MEQEHNHKTTASSWEGLTNACRNAAALAQEVEKHLSQGGTPSAVVPLLRQQLELAEQISDHIRRLAGQPADPRATALCQTATDQLSAVLKADQRNRQLLSRRGMRLHSRPQAPQSPLRS